MSWSSTFASTSSSGKRLAQLAIGVAAAMIVGAFAAGCGSEDAPAPAATPAAKPAPAAAPKPAKAPPPPHIPSNLTVEKKDAEGNPVAFSGTDQSGKQFQAAIGDDVEIPSVFPSDVPTYPGSTPMAAMTAAGEGAMVTFKAAGERDEVYDFYQSELASGGWSIDSESSFGGQRSLEASKDSRTVSVSITGTKEDSRVSVIVTGVN